MARNSPTNARQLLSRFEYRINKMTENHSTATYRDFPGPRWLLPVCDIILALVAFMIAYVVRYELQIVRPVLEINRAPFLPYIPYAAFYALWLSVNYWGIGLYKSVRGRSLLEEVYKIASGVTNATVVLFGLYFFFQPLAFSRLMLLYVAAGTVALLTLARIVQRIVQADLRRKGIGVQRVLIVGAGNVGQAVLRTIIARKELGYFPVGYLDDDPERGSVDLGRVNGLGKIDNLETALHDRKVNLAIITLPWTEHSRIMKLIETCHQADVEVRVVPDVFQLNLRQVQVENLDGIPLLGVNSQIDFHGANRLVKRTIDLGMILVASPVLLVILAVVALAIRLEGPGPIIYRQRRVGEDGREFFIYKFRSMIPDADRYKDELVKTQELDPRHPKLKNDPRITRVGRFIRRTSIDELPNVVNVLKGQMSLVGPRPPTPDEVALYEPWHAQRLQILPGMTGLWQVSGRSEVPFDEMCLLDIYYIENWSIGLDIQIMLMTLPRVLLRQGAY
jgi:exopolysaccharide biosynthesis polyprenyl glycosylphosphotransferase